MEIDFIIDRFETDKKTLCRFLRQPQWSVMDITKLDESSLDVVQAEFNKWNKSRRKIQITVVEPEDEPILLPLASEARKTMAALDRWLLRRLRETGRAIEQLNSDGDLLGTKWRKLGRYDTTRNYTEDEEYA